MRLYHRLEEEANQMSSNVRLALGEKDEPFLSRVQEEYHNLLASGLFTRELDVTDSKMAVFWILETLGIPLVLPKIDGFEVGQNAPRAAAGSSADSPLLRRGNE